MRRRLNLRVLACLVVVLLVLAAGIHWLHGYQVQRNAGALLEQADRAEEQGDLAGTVDYLASLRGPGPHRCAGLGPASACCWTARPPGLANT